MKKIPCILAGFAMAINGLAQPWNLSLNTVTANPNFGTINAKPIDFYTNNTKWMSLSTSGKLSIQTLSGTATRFLQVDINGQLNDWTGNSSGNNTILFGDGTFKTYPFSSDGSSVSTLSGYKFGINTSPVVELDVMGSGKISNNFDVGGTFTTGNRLSITTYTPTSGIPATIFFGINSSTISSASSWAVRTYKQPCNVWYANTTITNNGPPYSVPWAPSTNNSFTDLLQIYESQPQKSVISLGLLNGDGVLALEPLPTNNSMQKLKINPGCSTDVYICEGGGYTRIAGDGSSGGTWQVGSSGTTPGSQLDVFINSGKAKGLVLMDPSLSSTNKNIFEVAKTGQTILGVNVQPINGSMLTIGQPSKIAPAISLLDNSVNPNVPIFNVWGDGKTEIFSSNTEALVVKNTSSGASALDVKTDGTTYIANCLGVGTPASTSSFLNVNAGSNTTNGNLLTVGSLNAPNAFVMNSSGAINLTTANMNSGYALRIKNTITDLFAVKWNGFMYAREVVVSLSNFPDYVFDKTYCLPKLSEVKTYIQQNHKLPNMPSAKEVEQNGAALGEIQKLTVEKVEELYLYIFQLEAKIEALNSRITQIEQK